MIAIKNAVIAGPNIIPQKPYVLIPAMIEKNINTELILIVLFRKSSLMTLIIIGLINVSAMIDMTITEYSAIVIAVVESILVQAYSDTGSHYDTSNYRYK